MEIKVTAIEKNERRNNTATINGFDVEIIDALALTGSEKQVAWATDIRAAMLKDVVAQQANAKFANGLADADELDAWLVQANKAINTEIAPRIADKTSAKVWIDNRNNGLRAIIAG